MTRLGALREAAREMLETSIPVLLIEPNGKRPLPHPKTGSWHILTEPEEADSIDRSDINLAVLLGEQTDATRPYSPVGVVDFDGPEAWNKARDYGVSSSEPVWIAKTPSGGYHVYYSIRDTDELKRITHPGGLPVDLLVNGYALIAPSQTERGSYRWWDRHGPLDIPGSELYAPPEGILRLWRGENGTKPAARRQDMAQAIPAGARNSRLASVAGVLHRRGLSPEAVESALLAENEAKCKPPLPENEVRQIAKSITSRYSQPQPPGGVPPGRNGNTPFPLSDMGNAEFFAAQHADTIRYDHRRDRWLVWHNHSWRADDTAMILRAAKATARRRYEDAWDLEDDDDRKAAAKHAFQLEARAKVDAMLALAKSEIPIADAGGSWDIDPWLMGFKNGVLDLRTSVFRNGRPEDRITMRAGVAYDPLAECPRWHQFLAEIFNDDIDLVDFVWRALGYSLTGDTREQVVFILYGDGSNGKSRFLGATREALGDYAHNAPFSTFETGIGARAAIPNDVAALVGRRLVTSSETGVNSRMNEARMKALTGGDRMTARFLHGEFFEFQPVSKFWLGVNHRPRVYDDSYGFWRRVRLIPFDQTFKGDTDDKNLENKLRRELPGIMAWMVQGCLTWQREGLESPAGVTVATEEYRESTNPISEFVDECVVREEGAVVQASAAWNAYKEWCEREQVTKREEISRTRFGLLFSRQFGKSVKEHAGKYRNTKVYRGVRLI